MLNTAAQSICKYYIGCLDQARTRRTRNSESGRTRMGQTRAVHSRATVLVGKEMVNFIVTGVIHNYYWLSLGTKLMATTKFQAIPIAKNFSNRRYIFLLFHR